MKIHLDLDRIALVGGPKKWAVEESISSISRPTVRPGNTARFYEIDFEDGKRISFTSDLWEYETLVREVERRTGKTFG